MLEIETDKLLENAIREGLREGIKNKLSNGYNSPLDKLVDAALSAHGEEFRALLSESLASCMSDKLFREDVASSVRSVLARTLVQRLGARITLAIEEIVKQK